MSESDRADKPETLDLLIRGGAVLDGAGSPAAVMDVGVRRGRLVLGEGLRDCAAKEVIDAAGLTVGPGFIDIHGHSEFNALVYPRADSKVLSGVTTEVSGNCGGGAFPLTGELLRRREVEYESLGLRIDWRGAADYFARAEAAPSSVNRIVLIGHGDVRAAVMDYSPALASREQIEQMTHLVAEGMEAGAWGFSSGLIYAPGCFAETGELTALARVAAEHGGYYASHIRGEGRTILDAVDEFMTIVSTSGARGQLSHIKINGPKNWHLFEPLKQRLFRAWEGGLDFLADRYPYTAASTDLLSVLLPASARSGTLEEVLARLSDPASRQRIERYIYASQGADFGQRIMICDVKTDSWQDAAGKRLAEVANQRGGADIDTAFELMIADRGQTTCVNFSQSEDQLRETLTWPFVMIGSDGSIRDGLGPDSGQRCHPRAYGTPARFLGTYVRQLGLLDWPEAVYKMTGLPAKALRLNDRGLIADGLAADVVIFDQANIADLATFDCPAMSPAGIEYVIVNGQVVVRHGRHSETYPGRLLRKR